MTVFEAYEDVLRELKKFKTASFYPEDFTYFYNKAIEDKINEIYALYEKNQQLSDDLQNIYRHIIINLDDSVPFPLNITYIDGSPFVRFNQSNYIETNGTTGFFTHIIDGLNTSTSGSDYRLYSDNSSINNINNNIIVEVDNDWTGTLPKILDQLIFGKISDGVIIKVSAYLSLRDYREDDNTNYYPFAFNLNENNILAVTPANPAYLQFNLSTGMYDLIEDKGFKIIDEKSILVKAPSNYLHLLGLDNTLSVKNSIECEKTFNINLPVKRLTADTFNTIKTNSWLETSIFKQNNYFKETNSLVSTSPDFIIEYCSEKEKKLVSLDKVEMQYLKSPLKYVLTDDDVNSDNDNTESIEFQEYMCHEFIEKTVELFLEQHTDPRIQSYRAINDSNKRSREEN